MVTWGNKFHKFSAMIWALSLKIAVSAKPDQTAEREKYIKKMVWNESEYEWKENLMCWKYFLIMIYDVATWFLNVSPFFHLLDEFCRYKMNVEVRESDKNFAHFPRKQGAFHNFLSMIKHLNFFHILCNKSNRQKCSHKKPTLFAKFHTFREIFFDWMNEFCCWLLLPSEPNKNDDGLGNGVK